MGSYTRVQSRKRKNIYQGGLSYHFQSHQRMEGKHYEICALKGSQDDTYPGND